MNEILETIKTERTGIPDIKTIGIGLEPNLTPDDYPSIRIGPNTSWSKDYQHEYHTISLYIAFNLRDKIGFSAIYTKLYEIEAEIRRRITPAIGNYMVYHVDTTNDDDKIQGYKVLICRVKVERV